VASNFDFGDALFNRPAVEGGADPAMLPPDPAVPTRVRVTLDNLIPYAGNPRTVRNPEYDDIKLSIRNRGLDHAPNVTRPSPDQPYMIKDGGNTRLQILRELYEETGDRRFFEIDCMFFPWKGERDVLIAHMIENVMRGRMTFIDCARAAVRLKHYLEAEQHQELSVRELARQITELGWTIHQPPLSVMIYAHEVLDPYLPNTLNAGMGRPAIMTIRKYLDAARVFWESVATPEEGSFDDVWQPLFAKLDEDDLFDVETARTKLEDEIALRLDAPILSVSAEIQGIEKGISSGGYRPTQPNFDSPPPSFGAAGSKSVKPAPASKSREQMEAAFRKAGLTPRIEEQGAASKPVVASRPPIRSPVEDDYRNPDPYLSAPGGVIAPEPAPNFESPELRELEHDATTPISDTPIPDRAFDEPASSHAAMETPAERHARLEQLRLDILETVFSIANQCGFENAISDPRIVRPDLLAPYFTTAEGMQEFLADPDRSSNGMAMTVYAILSRMSNALADALNEPPLSDSRANDNVFEEMGRRPEAVDQWIAEMVMRNAAERRFPRNSIDAQLLGFGVVTLDWMASIHHHLVELESLCGQLLWTHFADQTFNNASQ
jgi:ParB family protein of integrating conjugative element (PFGI_1 class)